MRTVLTAVITALLLAGCASQLRQPDGRSVPPGESAHAPPVQSASDSSKTLDEMLKDDDFDLPRALLLFSEKYYPEFSGGPHDVDVEGKLARFERYAEDLRSELRRDRSPRQRVRTLTDFVHVKLGLRFDQGDRQGENPENLFFDRVLQTRFGYCVSLSLAYVVFGQAAGLDVKGVRVPGHFAVAFKDTDTNGTPYEVILESTDYGDARSQMHYWSEHRFHANAVREGAYLTPLNDRQIFGTLYNNLAGITYLNGSRQLALKRYTRALELAPGNPEAMYNRAIVARSLEAPQDALRDLNEALRIDPNFVLALLARAGLLWEHDERDGAMRDLNEAMRKRPDWPEPHLLDGMFAMQEGRVDEGRKAFERALEIDPEFKPAHRAMADLERKLGNEEAARKHEEAAGDNP